MRSDEVRGPRDGIVLGYDTVRRYVNNDLFVSLVRGGWVGSRGAASTSLTEIVLKSLAVDPSVTGAATSSARDIWPIEESPKAGFHREAPTAHSLAVRTPARRFGTGC